MNDLSVRFPRLFAGHSYGCVRCSFARCDALPSGISNVNIVPFIGDLCVMIHIADKGWEIIGGTLEPDETYLEALHREALEEAGARVCSFHLFGAWRCRSDAPSPYRPHLPHPEFHRVVGFGDVELTAKPTNPSGGEVVTAVELVTVAEASQRFLDQGRADLAELYQCAHLLRSVHPEARK